MDAFDWPSLVGQFGAFSLALALSLSAVWWLVRELRRVQTERDALVEKVLSEMVPAITNSTASLQASTRVLERVSDAATLTPEQVARLTVLLERQERRETDR